jgi:thioredoxin-related protein
MNWLNPQKLYFWIGLLIILLLSAGVYVYNKNISNLKTHNDKKTNIPNAPSSAGDVRIMFFTVDWCPYCQKAKDPWEDFVANYHLKTVNGRRITCKEHNATEGSKTVTEAKPLIEKYDVKGYPTIIMLKDGEKIEFDAKISTFSLERFVTDMV